MKAGRQRPAFGFGAHVAAKAVQMGRRIMGLGARVRRG